jgi:hypothetical protein
MKKQLLVVTLLLFSAVNFAQQQNRHWYFGTHAHLNFAGGTITQPASEIMPSGNDFWGMEGCATISDYNTGDLLLYSDGKTILGANHQPIVNGTNLMGDMSSSQNIVFLPRPGNRNNFYAFTTNGITSYEAGLFFSEITIDPCTRIATVLNNASGTNTTPLLNHFGNQIGNEYECITTAKHSNGVDYWVIAQVNDFIYSYLVTSNGVVDGAGVANRPFSSYLVPTPPHGTASVGDTGKLKISQTDISPNVVRIAKAVTYQGVHSVRAGTFNRSTGVVVFNNNFGIAASAYGVEFSFNGNILYYSEGNNKIKRRNMLTNAALSDFIVPVNTSCSVLEVQLAPDNNIYVSNRRVSLGRISNANLTTATFTANAITLITDATHTTATKSEIGLPQLVQQHQQAPVPIVTLVANNDSIFMNSCTTTTSTVTVQANDTMNGTAIASPLSGLVIVPLSAASPTPTNGGITLNANGAITLLAGTPVGIYTLTYQICTLGSCPSCSNIGIIKVDVSGSSNVLVAANDSFSYDECIPMKMNVKYANPTYPDTLNGNPILATTPGITVQQVPGSLNPIPTTGSISLGTNGIITIGVATPPGIYKLKYKLLLNDTCASQSNEAVVTITVTQSAIPETIVITDAYVGVVAGGTSIDSILVNDTIGGIPCNSSNVVVMPYPGTQLPGITLNPDGTITVAAGTPNGDYSIAYYLCQPCLSTNCTSPRKVYVTVGLRANPDSVYFDSNGNYVGGNLNVFTNDVHGASPVTPSAVSITYASNPYFSIDTNVGSPTYGDIIVSSGLPTGWFHYQSNYTICELANPSSCATATVELWGEAAGRTSNNELKTGNKIAAVSVYPNPSSGVFSIQMDNQHTTETNVKIAVYTALGQVVVEKMIPQNNPQIDLSDFVNGTYFLKIQMGEETINKIIVKK